MPHIKVKFERFLEGTSLHLNSLFKMFQISENSPVGTVVGNLTVYDPDNLHLPLQKFHCVVLGGGPFKVSVSLKSFHWWIHKARTE